ncbi:MAG: hypothetical protein AVO35_09420 [Candidatus Aegiribacteria sp. MLS_C]|nr:MAG: hypothetical protein AVO35_09420 [Candidatus Aegiribacteria sp. MLS_C]
MPLAGATLAAAAGLPPESLVDQDTADSLSDGALVDNLLDRDPRLVAFTLYMWNSERSARLAAMLRERKPGLLTVGGGPEVFFDNRWLVSSGAFDLLVCGEGEERACRVLDPESVREIVRRTGGFLESGGNGISPGSYPDPWLTGYLDPSSGPVHLETVRGCPGTCTFCSYRRTHPTPLIMDAGAALDKISALSRRGASEVVFLDPTFNARPDLVPLLEGLTKTGLDYFGEMRGDLLDAETARLIGEAGFRTVEIGLQSCNPRSLELSGRPVDPEKVLQGALHLRHAGIEPIIDIMLGLPGDTPEDAVMTARMVRDRNLHRNVQVFYTCVLPGTGLRKNKGISYMELPPYYRDLGPLSDEFALAREGIADILGYDIDLPERPVLFEGWPGTICLDLDVMEPGVIPSPSLRLTALRVRSSDHWTGKDLLLRSVRRLRREEPFCVLDVVLVPGGMFPVDLIGSIRECDEIGGYSARTASILGREGNLRVAVLVEKDGPKDPGWLAALAGQCTVVVDTESPLELNEHLWEAGVCIRLHGEHWDMDRLSSMVPSMHQVFFESRVMEEAWSRTMDL